MEVFEQAIRNATPLVEVKLAGNGEILVRCQGQETFFSNRLHCPRCDISLGEPQPPHENLCV